MSEKNSYFVWSKIEEKGEGSGGVGLLGGWIGLVLIFITFSVAATLLLIRLPFLVRWIRQKSKEWAVRYLEVFVKKIYLISCPTEKL